MLTPLQFTQRADTRFADNEFQNIREGSFRDFAADIAQTFVAQAAVNVPDYEPGRNYTQGFIIRHSFAGATPVFLEAATAGLLPAPTAAVGDANWLAALSPASGPVLSQVGTVDALRHAQNFWVPGRLYILINRLDAKGQPLPDVYVRAVTASRLEPEGYALDPHAIPQVPVAVGYDLATDTTGPTWAYTRGESDALLAQKADLVNGLVPEVQLPARTIGNIDYRNRRSANGGTLAITAGSYWHVSAEVTLDLALLPFGEVFFLRISSFASNLVWTRLLATDGKVIGTYPQGTALLFRRNGPDSADLAVVTVSSEYPSYAGAFVPDALKTAVAGGSYTDNQLDATPPGSVATMQFRDAQYLYFCLLDEQITNGVLTYAWLRVPRASPAGGGGTAPDLSNYYTKAQGDARYAPKVSLEAGSGRTVTFDKERHWPTITTGTYALDATGAVVDVCFQLILAVGSSELAIPASGFVKLTSTAFDATKKNIYSFLVGVDGLIQYYLKQPAS